MLGWESRKELALSWILEHEWDCRPCCCEGYLSWALTKWRRSSQLPSPFGLQRVSTHRSCIPSGSLLSDCYYGTHTGNAGKMRTEWAAWICAVRSRRMDKQVSEPQTDGRDGTILTSQGWQVIKAQASRQTGILQMKLLPLPECVWKWNQLKWLPDTHVQQDGYPTSCGFYWNEIQTKTLFLIGGSPMQIKNWASINTPREIAFTMCFDFYGSVFLCFLRKAKNQILG